MPEQLTYPIPIRAPRLPSPATEERGARLFREHAWLEPQVLVFFKLKKI